MRNLETPAYKLMLYGALGSPGQAILAEALHRQYEATAVLDDLNALRARPGLRTKVGGLHDPIGVSQSVAGMDGVICLFDEDPASDAEEPFSRRFNALIALLDGLETAGVGRLMVVDDFAWLDSGLAPESPVHHLEQRLLASPVAWTLVQAPPPAPRPLEVEDFRQAQAEAEPLQRFAGALLDELGLSLHRHQGIRIDLSGGKG